MFSQILQILFVVVLVVAVPMMSHSTARKPEIHTLPRGALYFSATVSQWILVAIAIAVVLATRMHLRDLGFRGAALAPSLDWALGLTLVSSAGLLAVVLLERRGWWPPESELVYLLLPETRQEKVWCVLLVAPTAGLCEEFLYRGFVMGAFFRAGLPGWLVVLFSSVLFGMAHLYQGRSGFLGTSILGLIFATARIAYHSVAPVMVWHAVVDVVAGVAGPRYLFRGKT